MLKIKMHFLKTLFGALSIISLTPLKTKLHLFRTLEDTKICTNWADFKKVCLLLRKLGTVEHIKFVNYILTQKTSDLTFTEEV